MTQEKKQLLFKDLCARLPYGVICNYNCVIPVGQRFLDKANAKDKLKGIIPMFGGHIGFMVGIDRVDALEGDIKPYLRPISSMTEDEKVEYRKTQDKISVQWDDYGQSIGYVYANTINTYDWLNAHYFDYRGLIENGLALEAPEGLYKIE